jgi:hypothetical protein
VSLPFAATHWRGFVHQVVQLHVDRPPQGLSLAALLAEFDQLATAHGWMRALPIATIASLCTSVTLGLMIVTSIAAARARTTLGLLRALLALYLGVLFTSKVLNEQYFVIPVTLFAVAATSAPTRSLAARSFAAYRAFTIGAFIAAVLIGWHFLTFLPADVSDAFFKLRPYAIVGRMASWSGLSPSTFGIIPIALSTLALLPAYVFGTKRLIRSCWAGARLLSAMIHPYMPRARTASVLAIVLVAPVAVHAASLRATKPAATPPLDSNDRRVGAFYYLWWANPSHDPDVYDGNWREGASEKPLDGWYSVTSAKLRQDFRTARTHGIDLMVASFHEYDVPVVPTALQAAYEQNVVMAPLVELGELYVKPQYGKPHDGFTIQPTTADAIVEFTSKAIALYASSPAAWRPSGKLAVFFYDSYFFEPSWGRTTTDDLLERVVRMAGDEARDRGAPAPSRADMEAAMPATFSAMLEDTRTGHLWRQAYLDRYREFWQGIRRRLESQFGPLFIFSGESWNPGLAFHHGAQVALSGLDTFDATFMYSPSFVWVGHKDDGYERNWQRWIVRSVLQAQYVRGAGQPVVATVAGSYDDRVERKKFGFEIPSDGPLGNTYDLTWQLAVDLSPDLVLVSTWNEFFEGSGIEPTVVLGDRLLRATMDWAKRVRTSAPKKHGIVIGAESSAHLARGVPDPSVLGRYARNVQVVAQRELPDWSFDAVDIRDVERIDLSRYELAIVELGTDVPGSEAFAVRLEAWASSGGRVLVSNASSPGWQTFVRSTCSRSSDATHVSDGAAELVLPPASRPQACDVRGDFALRYTDGDAIDKAAAWSFSINRGRIAGTSMNVAGRDVYPGKDAGLLFCACVRVLIDGAPCGARAQTEIP